MAVFPSDSIRTKNWGTEVLTDSDLEAQLDLLHAYFTASLNATTGHSHDGTSNQGPKITTLGIVACTLPINFAKGADIASATTTDIGAMTGNYGDVTGTTTITGLGTVQAGTFRIVRFTGALTLTHNGTSLLLPSAANITTAENDVAGFVSLGSGNWKCVWYQRYSGASLVGYTAATALSGSVIQTVSNIGDSTFGPSENLSFGAVATGTTTLPADDTIPQKTEGDQYMTKSITPNHASNKLLVTVTLYASMSANSTAGCALFWDAGTGTIVANALAAAFSDSDASTGPESFTFSHLITAGSTNATKFTVRAGDAGGATTTFNGNGGARLYGGVMASNILIQEIKA